MRATAAQRWSVQRSDGVDQLGHVSGSVWKRCGATSRRRRTPHSGRAGRARKTASNVGADRSRNASPDTHTRSTVRNTSARELDSARWKNGRSRWDSTRTSAVVPSGLGDHRACGTCRGRDVEVVLDAGGVSVPARDRPASSAPTHPTTTGAMPAARAASAKFTDDPPAASCSGIRKSSSVSLSMLAKGNGRLPAATSQGKCRPAPPRAGRWIRRVCSCFSLSRCRCCSAMLLRQSRGTTSLLHVALPGAGGVLECGGQRGHW